MSQKQTMDTMNGEPEAGYSKKDLTMENNKSKKSDDQKERRTSEEQKQEVQKIIRKGTIYFM